MTPRVPADSLIGFATSSLQRMGMEPAKADAVADVLVEGDLLGHTTHGLQLLPLYLSEIEKKQMTVAGQPVVVADRPAAVTWDGRRLPGQWLTLEAIALACDRARTFGTCAVVIRRSHHIGALAAYLKRVTDQGLMILLTCSDASGAAVAPHGGYRGVYTPNPLAAAWPTDGDPVMLDVCQSITTNLMTRRLRAEGRKFPGSVGRRQSGRPDRTIRAPCSRLRRVRCCRRAAPITATRATRWACSSRRLTGGLAGHGRADSKEGWSATVFLEVWDPALFGGARAFARETGWLARACRESAPRPGFDRVRLPGESGLRRREAQLRDGVELHPDTDAGAAGMGGEALGSRSLRR